MDAFCYFLGMRPWRCLNCKRRFHAWAVPPRFALFVHCPRCGNLAPDRFAPSRIDRHKIRALLHFPAYRCDPCRHRFFSLRPRANFHLQPVSNSDSARESHGSPANTD